MAKKYVCSKCFEEFLTLDGIVEHIKQSHPELESVEDFIDIIDLDSREWSDISETVKRIKVPTITTEPSVPKDLLPEGWIRAEEYPEKPYYYYDGQYYCSAHKYLTKSENDFLAHLLAYHPRDFETVLKHIVKQSLQKKITEDMTKKQLETLVYEEVRDWLSKVEEKEPEALQRHVESYLEDLLSFFKGETDICPICSRVYTIDNKLHLDKIFQCLRRGIELYDSKLYQSLKEHEQQGKGYEFWKTIKYDGKWNGNEIGLSIYPLLHVYQDHYGTFVRLVKNGILEGIGDKEKSIIDFLYEKQYLKKTKQPPILKASEPTEKLSKGVVIKKQVNLSKGEQALIEWLKKGTVSKE
jgi:hypothetical protein